MKTIKIEIEGLNKLKTAFRKSPEIVRDQIQKAITQSIFLVHREAKLEAPVGVTGHLRSRMGKQITPFRGVIGPTVEYGLFVHEGTSPHWTSVKNLEKWANKKGINPFALQRSIARKGTKANPFMTRAVDQSEGKVQEFFQLAIDNVLKQLTK